MTTHPNAEYLRALADGKRVDVKFPDGYRVPLEDCSSTVQQALLRPGSVPQSGGWTFHIEQEQTP